MVDAEVVGSGPNGLAAAVVLARAGLRVRVYEANDSAGGSARTTRNLLPENTATDVGSAVHPMAAASPFFKAFELPSRIELLTPSVSYGHPVANGRAGIAFHSLEETVDRLGKDGARWRRIFAPLVDDIVDVSRATSATLLDVARHPTVAVRLGLRLAEQFLLSRSERDNGTVGAMLAGLNAHSISRLPSIGSAAVGLVLGAHAHAGGWPIPRGGSQAISQAMIDDIVSHGGSIELSHRVESLDQLSAPIKILDVAPHQLAQIGADAFPDRYRRRLDNFAFGAAASKVDFLLSEPVPWSNDDLRRAGTVHLGGSWTEIAKSENELARGSMASDPFVMVSQPSIVDDSRAGGGNQALWTYTHAPNGSTADMTELIVNQIERFAPGFRDVIISSRATTARQIGIDNVNHAGGDIATGAVSFDQLIARPSFGLAPWRTPVKGIYVCSAGTSPGPGVHGMAGYHAARLALLDGHGLATIPHLGIEGRKQ